MLDENVIKTDQTVLRKLATDLAKILTGKNGLPTHCFEIGGDNLFKQNVSHRSIILPTRESISRVKKL